MFNENSMTTIFVTFDICCFGKINNSDSVNFVERRPSFDVATDLYLLESAHAGGQSQLVLF